ncbi:MtrAB system histidine kinase MtrB [Isoptericola jiangsuensis]|uniref:MtrAB system histidine kinase MtrB n=1 Tax=Isoptericola jiangsuensis TaxID=548579 RepID=UPI003AB07B79
MPPAEPDASGRAPATPPTASARWGQTLGGLTETLATWFRSLARRWRSSMQVRVVTTALALGFVAVAVLGVYLSYSIRDGLFEQRVDQIETENAALTQQVRTTLAGSAATSPGDQQSLLRDVILNLSTVGSSAQDYFLRQAPGQSLTLVDPASSRTLSVDDVVTPELRAATLATDGQVLQSVLVPGDSTESGQDEPGVVVASTVEVPSAGTFELYSLYSLASQQETLRFVQRTLLLGALAILAMLGGLTWIFTRQTVVPVRRAATAAARLGEGRLDVRVPGSRGADEMATLARTFNEMAASLELQIARMEELSAAQRRFVSDVSHELRTPLTTIRMAAEVIHGSRDDLPPAPRRSAELMQTQLDRFEDLLTDLLEISRFDAGAAVLDVEPRDVRDVVTAVVDTAAPLAERKEIFLSVSMPDHRVEADIDPRRVERVLRNLVVNAIEHAEGKPVEVTVDGDDRAVAVVVRDHGVGLTPDEMNHVFDRFWRADPARARTTGGTGLGLAISQEDARLHAGRLEVWGRPGAGASFRLTLPRRAGIVVEASPLPLEGPSRAGGHHVPTGQVPVVNPPTGPTPSAIPDLSSTQEELS